MTLQEINKIIDEKYGEKGIHIYHDVYPEVEELYLDSPAKFDKYAVADFYQKYDYMGIRNALDIARNLPKLEHQVVYSDVNSIPSLTPSQAAYLKAIGWQVDKLVKMGVLNLR